MSTSSKHIEPDVGSSSRLRQRKNVDLPEPDAPITTITSPLRISALIPLRTSTSPNDLHKLSTLISTLSVVTVTQPPLKLFKQECKNKNYDKIYERNRNQREKRFVCP